MRELCGRHDVCQIVQWMRGEVVICTMAVLWHAGRARDKVWNLLSRAEAHPPVVCWRVCSLEVDTIPLELTFIYINLL